MDGSPLIHVYHQKDQEQWDHFLGVIHASTFQQTHQKCESLFELPESVFYFSVNWVKAEKFTSNHTHGTWNWIYFRRSNFLAKILKYSKSLELCRKLGKSSGIGKSLKQDISLLVLVMTEW